MTLRYRLFLRALDLALAINWWVLYHWLARPEYFATPEDLRSRPTEGEPF